MTKRCLALVMVFMLISGVLFAQTVPFDQCGTLDASDVTPCGLLHADDGTTYEFSLASSWNGFVIGDYVRVIGFFTPGPSPCMVGNCCITTTNVVACDAFSFNDCGVLIEGDTPDCWLFSALDGQLYSVPVGVQGYVLGDSVRIIGWANSSAPEICGGASAYINPTIAWNCCCEGIRGDVDGDGGAIPDVSDLTMLVAYLFYIDILDYHTLCLEEINVDGVLGAGNNPFDVVDLTRLVGYLFKGDQLPADCPQWINRNKD